MKKHSTVSWLIVALAFLVAVAVVWLWFTHSLLTAIIAFFATYLGTIALCSFVVIFVTIFKISQLQHFHIGFFATLCYRKLFPRIAELNALLEANDLERFFQETERFLAQQKLPKGLVRLIEYNQALAQWYATGNTAQALVAFEQAAQLVAQLSEKYDYHDDTLKAIFHQNLCFAYLEDGQVARAEEQYAMMQQLQSSKRLTQAQKALFQQQFASFEACFLFAHEEYNAARHAYLNLLQDKEQTKHFYNYHFHLAQICEALGDTQAQQEHLLQVIALGNQHYYTRIAQQKLAQLD